MHVAMTELRDWTRSSSQFSARLSDHVHPVHDNPAFLAFNRSKLCKTSLPLERNSRVPFICDFIDRRGAPPFKQYLLPQSPFTPHTTQCAAPFSTKASNACLMSTNIMVTIARLQHELHPAIHVSNKKTF